MQKKDAPSLSRAKGNGAIRSHSGATENASACLATGS